MIDDGADVGMGYGFRRRLREMEGCIGERTGLESYDEAGAFPRFKA